MKIINFLSDGNSSKYSVKNSSVDYTSPLKNKNIIFLGSSVTLGSASMEESFVDFLVKIDGINAVKEAVSGTTLVGSYPKSYVSRIKSIDRNLKADAFVCQLSTNDAVKKCPLGKVSEGNEIEALDLSTVAGAVEFIILYAASVWKCPVIFYTGTNFGNEYYEQMINLLYEISEKYNTFIIDLYSNENLNNISKKEYDLYMQNGIHPKRAGYKLWWTPQIRKELIKILKTE